MIRPTGMLPVLTFAALGAAFAAGLAVGFWSDEAELSERWSQDRRWVPQMDERLREREYAQWKKAVTRSFDWVA